ncbi:hypothetical protein BGZ79_004336 [Entomortierella chlamydospora]|nr:hypothetical protein BGZ79_004336 [Entomortierella chlamydospora]
MVRTRYTLRVKVEIINIYHYLRQHMTVPQVKDKSKTKPTASLKTFGEYIGIGLLHTTLEDFLKKEAELRQQAAKLDVGVKYIVNRKNRMLKKVVYRWLEVQRSKHLSVTGKMIITAAKTVYTIYADD